MKVAEHSNFKQLIVRPYTGILRDKRFMKAQNEIYHEFKSSRSTSTLQLHRKNIHDFTNQFPNAG